MKLMKFIIVASCIFSWGEAFAQEKSKAGADQENTATTTNQQLKPKISYFNHGTACVQNPSPNYNYEQGEVVETEGVCKVFKT